MTNPPLRNSPSTARRSPSGLLSPPVSSAPPAGTPPPANSRSAAKQAGNIPERRGGFMCLVLSRRQLGCAQQGGHRVKRDRLAEQVALHLVAEQQVQHPRLLFLVDAFRHHVEFERVRKRNDGG